MKSLAPSIDRKREYLIVLAIPARAGLGLANAAISLGQECPLAAPWTKQIRSEGIGILALLGVYRRTESVRLSYSDFESIGRIRMEYEKCQP
jgi:hypothetical protein